MDEKIAKRNELIKTQAQLITLFDNWVIKVKENDLEGAKQIKELSLKVRKQIWKLEEEIKNEKKSCIITKLN